MMKSKVLLILFISIMFTLVGCDEETLVEAVTGAVLGENSITLSGDISKEYNAIAMAGIMQEDTTSVFSLVIGLKESNEFTQQLLLAKMATSLPAVGTYDVGTINTDTDLGQKFTGVYSIGTSKMYYTSSGTVKITSSSSTKIAGTIDITAKYFDETSGTLTSKVLKIKGKFSTIPIDMN